MDESDIRSSEPCLVPIPAVSSLVLGLLGVLSPLPGQAQQPGLQSKVPAVHTAAAPLAFTGVTVVDVRNGQLLPDQTILIDGTRVQAVGNAGNVPLPPGAQVVDAQGKYVIPGLWDMHVHIWGYPQIFYPLFIANGVTGVREMSEPKDGLDSMLKWRREIIAGTRVGPRIVGTGGTFHPDEIAVTTPEEGRRAVDSLKAAGADFVKAHDDYMTRETYFAVAAEARRVGIPLVGHLPNTVTEVEASDSGQRTVEHFNEVHCWWPLRPSGPPSEFPLPDAAGEKRCAAVAAAFIRNGTWFVPTLTVSYWQSRKLPDRSRYSPEPLRTQYLEDIMGQSALGGADPTLEHVRQVMPLFHRLGIPLLAGTDATPQIADIAPGFSLHDELSFLVEVGLTPLEALQAATLSPAKLFKATDSLGVVASGKVADLVLLDANPLADIHNTTKIRAVVANGRYFDRAALDALVAKVEAAANENQNSSAGSSP